MQFWLGVLTVVVLVMVPYALWRYAFQPWKALRADVSALNLRFEQAVAEMRSLATREKVFARTDEDVAFIERKTAAKQAARSGRVVGERETL